MKNVMNRITGYLFAVLILASIASTSLGLTSGGLLESAVQQKKERVLVIPVQTESKTWDPMVGYGAGSDTVTYNVYEGLMAIDQLANGTWMFKPLLATSWTEAANHSLWTFQLRENVTFHDGSKFNSSAVVYWFDRMRGVNRGPAWLYDTYISKVEAVDTYTVKIYLKQAMPAFDFKCIMSNVFGAYGIVSPTYVKQHATASDPWAKTWMYNHTCGTGPYKVENVTHGVQSVWVKNPNYWGGWTGNHVDTVIYQVVPNLQTMMLKFLKKEVDMFGPEVEQIPNVIAQLPDAKLDIDREYLSVTYIFMNMGKVGPLQDINVRKAVSAAFDYEGIVKYVLAGYAAQAKGPLPHGIPYLDKDVFQYSKNLTLAKQYLANSSHPNGFTATIAVGPGNWERIGEVFQRDMAELNITINIQSLTYATLWDLMLDPETAPEFSIALWYPDYPTADVYITPVFGPMATAWQNWAFYENPVVNTLLDQGRFEFNESKQAQTYKEVQKLIVQDAPCVFMYEGYRETFLQSYVMGYKRSPIHNGVSIYQISIEGKYPAEPQPQPQPQPTGMSFETILLIGVAAATVVVVAIFFLRKR